jgi:hypothetical protein
MNNETMDSGVIQVLLDRLSQQRLPQLLELKERVDRGEKLNGLDIAHLQQAFSDYNQIKSIVDKHPELQSLVAQVIHLYKQISDKALENERNG